jgi:hypothetical protein
MVCASARTHILEHVNCTVLIVKIPTPQPRPRRPTPPPPPPPPRTRTHPPSSPIRPVPSKTRNISVTHVVSLTTHEPVDCVAGSANRSVENPKTRRLPESPRAGRSNSAKSLSDVFSHHPPSDAAPLLEYSSVYHDHRTNFQLIFNSVA